MPSKRAFLLLGLVVACLVTGSGCQTVPVKQSVLPRLGGNDPQQQLDYWHETATKTLISNDEAFHGLLLYLDGKDDSGAYDQRVAALKSRGCLTKSFHQPADQAVERGTVAVTLVKSLKITGGITMRLTGITPRYATRELIYRDIYPTSSDAQIFTGAEFVGVIGKAEDFRMGDPTNRPASDVPAVAEDKPDEVAPIFAMMAPDPGSLTLSPTTAATSQVSGPLKITITAVEGLAAVRADENSPWKPATKGMELAENAEFRTGPRGTIQFFVPPDQTVTVDRLTTMKVLQLVQKGGKVTTDIGIKYGRTRYDLEGGGLEHQSTLRSPNATLAVRGTKVSLFDQPPFAPQAVSLTGRAEFRAQRRRPIFFGNRGQGKTIVNASSTSAGDLALRQTVVDPALQGARTSSEEALLTTVISRGANVSIDRTSGIPIVTGGTPPTDAQLIPSLPGRLNFVLRWDSNVNLDLGVVTPATARSPGGEFVYPAAGINVAPSGGKTAFDHRGGPNGGIEVVYFDKFTEGFYTMAGPIITNGGTGGTTTATLEAFLDGKQLNLFDGSVPGGAPVVTQIVDGPNNPALATIGVGVQLPTFAKSASSAAASGRPTATLMGPMAVNPVPKVRPAASPAPVAPKALSKRK